MTPVSLLLVVFALGSDTIKDGALEALEAHASPGNMRRAKSQALIDLVQKRHGEFAGSIKNGEIPFNLLEKSGLDQTLGKKCDTDCRQNNQIQELKKHAKRDNVNFEKMKKKHEVYSAFQATTKKNMENHTAWTGSELGKITDSWQALANELRDMVIKKKANSDDQFEVGKEKLYKTLKSVAAIFLYQQAQSKKVMKQLDGEKAKIMKEIEKNAARIQKNVQESATGLKSSIKKLTGQTKKMKATIVKEMATSNKAVMTKIGAVSKMVDEIFKDAAKKVEKQKNNARVIAKDLKETTGELEDEKSTLADHYDSLNERLNKDFNAQKKAEDRDARKTQEHVNTATDMIGDDLRELAKKTMKAFVDMDSSNAAALAKLGKGANGNIKKIMTGLENTDKEFMSMVNGAENDLEGGANGLGKFMDGTNMKLADMNGVIDGQKSGVDAMTESLVAKFSNDAESMSDKLGSNFASIAEQIGGTESSGAQALVAAKEKLLKNLAAVNEATDMGLGDLEKKLGAFSTAADEQFDASGAWQDDFNGMLGDFGGDVALWEQESGAMLEAMGSSVSGALDENGNAVAGFGGDLLAALGGMGEKVSNDVTRVEAEQGRKMSQTEENFRRKLQQTEARMNGQMGGMNAEMGQMGSLYNKGIKDQKNANAQNLAAAEGILNGDLPALEGAEAANAAATKNNLDGMNSGLVNAEVSMTTKMQGSFGAAKDQMAGEVAASEEKSAAEMEKWMKNNAGQVDGKVGELSALEKAMARGNTAFAGDAKSMSAQMARLQAGAAKVNQEVSEHFSSVQSRMSAENLLAYESEEDLMSAMTERKNALEGLARKHLAKMSEAEQQQFKDMLHRRQLEVERTMNDQSLTFEQKKQKLSELDKGISSSLTTLESAAHLSNEELAAIHRNQTTTATMVQRAAKKAMGEISGADMLSAQTEVELKAQLERRGNKIKGAIGATGGSMSGELAGRIDAVLADAGNRITGIWANDNLTDEQKRKQIEAIDAATSHAMADLAAQQVAAEKDMEAFEENASDFDSQSSNQMAALENVLKEGQMEWIRHMVSEKKFITSQGEELVGLVENLMEMMGAEAKASGSELSEQYQQSKLSLQQVKLSMKENAQQGMQLSGQAMTLANLATQKAASDKSMTMSELSAMEGKLGSLSSGLSSTGLNLKAQLSDESKAREEAMSGEKSFMVKSSSTVLEQLESVADILSQAADRSSEKQQELVNRIKVLKSTMEKAIEGAQKTTQEQMALITTHEQKIAASVEQTKDWQAKYGGEIASHEQKINDKIGQMESELRDSDAKAKGTLAAAETAAEKEISGEGGVLAKEAKKDEGIITNTITGVLDDQAQWMQTMEKQGHDAKERNEKLSGDLSKKTETQAESLSADQEKLLEQADKLTARLGEQDTELEQLQTKVTSTISERSSSYSELYVKAQKDVEKLKASVQKASKSSLIEAGDSKQVKKMQSSLKKKVKRRIAEAERRLKGEESRVESVEEENRNLRAKLEAMKSMKGAVPA